MYAFVCMFRFVYKSVSICVCACMHLGEKEALMLAGYFNIEVELVNIHGHR